ncbi:MAG: O-antigen/teichoic acid export membrane protein [Candidatus Poriferisodalaceae bacterium]|jgi:O-antigen/teichoic acid export membrane protein
MTVDESDSTETNSSQSDQLKVGPEATAGDSRARVAAKGFFWSGSSFAAQGIFQLVVVIVLARRLTPSEFGIAQVTIVAIGIGRLFTGSVVGPAVVQRAELEPRHIRTAVSMSVGFGLATSVALFVVAGPVAALFNDDRLIDMIRIVQFSFVIQALAVVPEALLQRELRFKTIAQAEVISFALGYAGVGVALGLANAGVWALVGAQLGQVLVHTVLLLISRPTLRPSYNHQAARDIISFGGGFTLGRIFNYAALQGDNIVVGSMLSSAALGVYGRAYQLLATPAMLMGQVIDRVLFPMLASIQDKKDLLRLQYWRAVSLVALVMLPLSSLVLVLAPEIVRVILGPDWEAVVTPLRILAVSLVARTSYKVSDCLSKAVGLVYRRAARQATYATLVVGGAAIGQTWGIAGVSIGVAFAVVANFGLMADLSLRALEMSWREFATAHLRGTVIALIVLPLSLGVAEALRGAGAGAFVVVMVVVALNLAVIGVVSYLRPIMVFGPAISVLWNSVQKGNRPALQKSQCEAAT